MDGVFLAQPSRVPDDGVRLAGKDLERCAGCGVEDGRRMLQRKT
jgi:hypothetical protein